MALCAKRSDGMEVNMEKRTTVRNNEIDFPKFLCFNDSINLILENMTLVIYEKTDKSFGIEYVEQTKKNQKDERLFILMKKILKQEPSVLFKILFSLILAFLCACVIILINVLINSLVLLPLTFFLSLAFAIIILYIVATKLFLKEKEKSKYTAMNKVINYVYNNQKLPENLKDIQNSSRYFGISNLFYTDFFMIDLIALISFSIPVCLLFLSTDFLMQIILAIIYLGISCILYFLCLFINKKTDIFCKLNSIIEKKLSVFVQFMLLSKSPSSYDLFMAYCIVAIYLRDFYPDLYKKTDCFEGYSKEKIF